MYPQSLELVVAVHGRAHVHSDRDVDVYNARCHDAGPVIILLGVYPRMSMFQKDSRADMSTSHPQGTAPRRVRYHTGCSAVLLHRRWFIPPGRTPTCRLVLHASGGTSHRKRSLKKMASSGFSCPTKPVTCLVRKASRIAHLRARRIITVAIVSISAVPPEWYHRHCHPTATALVRSGQSLSPECPLPIACNLLSDYRCPVRNPIHDSSVLILILIRTQTNRARTHDQAENVCMSSCYTPSPRVRVNYPALGPLAFRPWTPSRRERRRRRG